jgi:hypothetical protein
MIIPQPPMKKNTKQQKRLCKSHQLNINLNMLDACVNILQNNIPLVNYMLYSEVYLWENYLRNWKTRCVDFRIIWFVV